MTGWLVDGRREEAGVNIAGVGGPNCPWSSMCSREASSCLRYIDLERGAEQRDGYWPAHFTPNAPAWSARCIRISGKHICLD
jgi:hypothetical protein